MRSRTIGLVLAAVLLLAACSSGSGDDAAVEDGTAGNDTGTDGGDAASQSPPGQATASVDGLEYTFDTPGPLACNIEQDTLTFSYIIGDNEVGLAGGANLYDDGWLGSIDLRVANPDNEPGPITYFADVIAHGDGISIDGASMSYSGPMMKQPANDGSNPPPVEVGNGTISTTCG